MMRTEAPNEREGRGLENLARTTPELPKQWVISECCSSTELVRIGNERTVRAGDLAPDHANLGSTDLLLGLVDVRNLLAEVEAVSLSADDAPSLGEALRTYLAAGVSSTPSILIKLVLGRVLCRERW